MKKSAGKVLFKGILGIIVFLIFIGILNLVAVGVSAVEYQAIVEFFNYNLLFILLISLIMLVGDVFEAFIFPFNILYPFFNAVGGALYVILAFRGLELIDFLSKADISGIFDPFYVIILLVVFFIVLIVGLVKVFVRLGHVERRGLRHEDVHHEWSDVGDTSGSSSSGGSNTENQLTNEENSLFNNEVIPEDQEIDLGDLL